MKWNADVTDMIDQQKNLTSRDFCILYLMLHVNVPDHGIIKCHSQCNDVVLLLGECSVLLYFIMLKCIK